MPELPDVTLYVTRLRERLLGTRLEAFQVDNPFVVRSVSPRPAELVGLEVINIERLGKRIVIGLEGDRFIVVHLMIAGRFQWQSPLPPAKRATGKVPQLALRFTSGQLGLVESSTKKRAAIHVVGDPEGLTIHRRNGLDLFSATPDEFQERLQQENRTLKRALTSPALFDGIGNAYSDEILFEARLSPVRTTRSLSDEEMDQLYEAAKATLHGWSERLEVMFPGFPRPSDITAFRPEFAVHGRFGKPCPDCGAPVSGSCTPKTRPTTVPAAKTRAASSRTAAFPGFSATTGPRPWKR
jgi:formamidopyrimidine-DNA glycosylase